MVGSWKHSRKDAIRKKGPPQRASRRKRSFTLILVSIIWKVTVELSSHLSLAYSVVALGCERPGNSLWA